jgi:hypothetical protein
MSTVLLELRVGDTDGTHRGCRHMFVASPASGRVVRISATNPAPHQAAVFVYLEAHRQHIRTVQLVERRPATAATPALWVFVATLELPHAEV